MKGIVQIAGANEAAMGYLFARLIDNGPRNVPEEFGGNVDSDQWTVESACLYRLGTIMELFVEAGRVKFAGWGCNRLPPLHAHIQQAAVCVYTPVILVEKHEFFYYSVDGRHYEQRLFETPMSPCEMTYSVLGDRDVLKAIREAVGVDKPAAKTPAS